MKVASFASRLPVIVLAAGLALALLAPCLVTPAQAGLVGSPTSIAPFGSWWPTTCYNATSNQYLVMYDDKVTYPPNQFTAKRIDANTGAIVGSTMQFQPNYLSSTGNAAYNSATGEWLVVIASFALAVLCVATPGFAAQMYLRFAGSRQVQGGHRRLQARGPLVSSWK